MCKYRVVVVSFLFLFLLAPIIPASEGSSDRESTKVLISEVNPFGDGEGISLFNYGRTDVNLKGWEISDGEGHLVFAKNLYLGPDSRLTVVKSVCEGDWFSGRDGVITFSDDRIQKKGSFILANTGDDIYVHNGDFLVDSMCYGNKTSEIGWVGEPADISSNRYLLRTGPEDTDSSADWTCTKPGITNHVFDPDRRYDSLVTPFSFPESQGIPIFTELEKAEREVLISMYLLTSTNLAALLCELSSDKNISVQILLEGSVLGYDMGSELMLMRSIHDAGVTVRLINDSIPGNPERYSHLHNKYAVIDGRKVIVTSENWTSDNLSPDCSNRGWGAVIESPELAGYMREVFFSDMNPEFGDVISLLDMYPGLKPRPGTMVYDRPHTSYEDTAFAAEVMPVLSPDNSLQAIRHLIDGAENRIYSQQMDLGSSFARISGDSPLKWMSSAADRGVDARLILDSSIGGSSKDDTSRLINSTSGVKTIALNGGGGFSLIHNKGVIADDAVWVGSVNWTENSFMNNREFAVVIRSAEVTDFFTGLFLDDWGTNEHTVAETGLDISHDVLYAGGRMLHVFTVSGPEDSAYTWDVLGDGTVRRSGTNRIVCEDIPGGDHTMSVTMDGTGYSATYAYTADVPMEPRSGENTDTWLLAGASIFIIAGCLRAVLKRRNNNRR